MCEREVAEQCSFFGGTRNLLSDHGTPRRKAGLESAGLHLTGPVQFSALHQDASTQGTSKGTSPNRDGFLEIVRRLPGSDSIKTGLSTPLRQNLLFEEEDLGDRRRGFDEAWRALIGRKPKL